MTILGDQIEELIRKLVREELLLAREEAPLLKEFYSDEELRELAGNVSSSTTRRWRKLRLISYSQPPGSRSVMYTREQLREFFKSYERHSRGVDVRKR